MKRSEWLNPTEPDSLLQHASGLLDAGQLRMFACECCRRLLLRCANPFFLKVLAAAERRAAGIDNDLEIEAVRSEFSRLYDSLYPGYGSPSPAVLALSAFGEPAFTKDPLTAAKLASSTAAMAVAGWAAELADDSQYDVTHDAAYARESIAQAEMLKSFCLRGDE